jgi:hypothetical protein
VRVVIAMVVIVRVSMPFVTMVRRADLHGVRDAVTDLEDTVGRQVAA